MEKYAAKCNRHFYSIAMPWAVHELTIEGDHRSIDKIVESLKDVAKALKTPLLRAEYHEKDSTVDWVYKETTSLHFRVIMSEPTIIANETYIELNEEDIPFRADIFLCSTNRFVLRVFVSHAIGDGRSGSIFLKEFVAHYCNGEPVKQRTLMSDEEIVSAIAEEVKLPISMTQKITKEMKKLEANRNHYKKEDIIHWKNKSLIQDDFGYVIHTISGENYQRFLLLAKKYDATVTSLLLGLFHKMLSSGEAYEASVSTDCRKFFAGSEDIMGNFASGFKIDYQYDPLKSLAENVRIIDKEVREKAASPVAMSAIVQIHACFDTSMKDALLRANADPEISKEEMELAKKIDRITGYESTAKGFDVANLGYIDFGKVNKNYKIKSYVLLPTLLIPYTTNIGVVSTADSMSIGVVYKKNEVAAEKIQTYVDRAWDIFMEECRFIWEDVG